MSCRIRRRRLWTFRLLMEMQDWPEDECLFVTLTYDEKSVPADGSLNPRDLVLFLKRLRKRLWTREKQRVRYYGVGEYGERTNRPHFHIILFGVRDVADVRAVWTKGHVHAGTVSESSIAYVCGYVTNFRLGITDEEKTRLGGRYREFARMSRRPGLGAAAMEQLSRTLQTRDGSRAIANSLDVPNCLRVGRRQYGIGRYLRRKLRELCGTDEDMPKLLHELRQEMEAAELRAPGARFAREEKRVQASRNAQMRESILKSKGKL